MDPLLLVLIIVGALVVVGLVVMANRKKHTDELKGQFGDEYDRTLEHSDSQHAAEQALEERRDRVSQYDIRPLTTAQRDRYTSTWTDVQSEFVDHPDNAVRRAHTLIDDVMRDKGYPVDDFEHQYEDLSVNHPKVVSEYRAGHDIVTRHEAGDATTEEMRRGMIHYRTLFDELMRDVDQAVDRATGDRDGDGMPNALDTRDTPANPPRPASERPLGDRDGDGTPNALDARDERGDRNRLMGDRDGDGTPNALDARDEPGDRNRPLGDRDGDGMPNALDTQDERPVAPPPSAPPRR